MKEIKLTRGLFVMVDDEDYEYLNQWNWYTNKSRNTYYAARYATKNGKEIVKLLHREILNTPDNLFVDHIDHNGLNCQKYNIRNCTRSQNAMNRIPWGKSKYLGVSVEAMGRHIGRIKAQVRINKKVTCLGYFKTEELAALAYNEAAKKHYGEFANLNII